LYLSIDGGSPTIITGMHRMSGSLSAGQHRQLPVVRIKLLSFSSDLPRCWDCGEAFPHFEEPPPNAKRYIFEILLVIIHLLDYLVFFRVFGFTRAMIFEPHSSSLCLPFWIEI
jgi:hypothetical protein